MGVQRSVDVLGSVNESVQNLIQCCRKWASEHVHNAKVSSSTAKKLKKPPANCLDLVNDFCKTKGIGSDVAAQLVCCACVRLDWTEARCSNLVPGPCLDSSWRYTGLTGLRVVVIVTDFLPFAFLYAAAYVNPKS